jgi:hypothetical protein
MMHVRLGVRLRVLLLLADDLSSHNVFPDIILLGQVEESPDLGGTLGAETLGQDNIGKAGDLTLALLDDDEGEDSDIGADDAATDGLAAALTSAANPVAGVAIGKEELDTVWQKDTLLHRETLLVVSTSDAENVALPFVAERITGNFLRDFLVVDKSAAK